MRNDYFSRACARGLPILFLSAAAFSCGPAIEPISPPPSPASPPNAPTAATTPAAPATTTGPSTNPTGSAASGACSPPNAAQAFASYNSTKPNPPPAPDLLIEASEEVQKNFPNAPPIQSFAFAQSGGAWVFIGGRAVGFHGFSPPEQDFPRSSANKNIVVVVPAATGPAKTFTFPVDNLPAALNRVKQQWLATNPVFYQDGDTLYIGGGYGPDEKGNFITFPVLSSVNLPALIKGVTEGKDTFSNTIAWTESPLFQTTGGELLKLPDGNFYVVMGQNFQGLYSKFTGNGEDNSAAASQTYLKEVRKVQVTRAGTRLTVKSVATFRDENQFGRRDLNVAHTVLKNGDIGIGVYGGVFTPDPVQLNYYYPLYFTGTDYFIDYSYEQKMSQYSCAKVVFYSTAQKETLTTFFGGISRFSYDYTINQFSENPRVGVPGLQVFSDGMPWIDTITTMQMSWDAPQQTKYNGLPHPVTTATSEQPQPTNRLPGYLGAEAMFIPVPGLKRYKDGAEVFDYDSLPAGQKTHIGYIYGGIEAQPCDANGKQLNSGTIPTQSSARILKVYATRTK